MLKVFEDLSPEQQHFAHLMFTQKVLKANGQAFEDLFTAVMTRRYDQFRQVKPQGRKGDQGNDGFIPEKGRYFQVHAPEDPKDKAQDAAKKAGDDFDKLKKHWMDDSEIIDFRFVFNDKYQGVFPDIEHALAALKKTHHLDGCKPFVAKDLEREFVQLSVHDMQAVLQSVVPRAESIEDIEYAALTEILQHIVDNQDPVEASGIPAVPDYGQKIQFNGIKHAASLLTVGNFQNAAVSSFFDKHGEFKKTDIRNRLAQSYRDAKQNVGVSNHSMVGDSIFFALLESIAPDATKYVQDAAIVLIAYFFETCDVFEEPKN